MSDSEESPLIELGVAANLSRLYAEDQRGFLEGFGALLESVLPGGVEVERSGGLFARKQVRAIQIPLGDNLYRVESGSRGPLEATRTRVVRGIRLKTDRLPVEVWLEEVSEALAAYARDHREAREALRRFTGGQT